jgi:hypothetical protein
MLSGPYLQAKSQQEAGHVRVDARTGLTIRPNSGGNGELEACRQRHDGVGIDVDELNDWRTRRNAAARICGQAFALSGCARKSQVHAKGNAENT